MKRLTSIILGLALILSMTACTAKQTDETDGAEDTVETEDIEVPDGFDPDFTFSTTDRNGNAYTEAFFSQNKVTMVNFWEPWCGPCVGEMPELQQLYKNYSDQGFAILGVYSETGMESEVDQIIDDSGVEYPLLHYVDVFDQFQSGYVPTTIFVDSNGHVLKEDGESLYIGANDYSGWEAIILKHLGK